MQPEERDQESVTVVIPTIGRDSLEKAIHSAWDQTCPPAHVIVVDDSPNGIDRVRKEAMGPVIWIGGPKRGAGAARNSGVREVQDQWVAFLDDDDFWEKNKLEVQIGCRSSTEDVILSCRARVNLGGYTRIRPRRLIDEQASILHQLFGRPRIRASQVYLPTPSFVVPTRLARSTPFDEELHVREDIWWVHQLQAQGATIIQLPQVLLTVNTDLSGGFTRETWLSQSKWSDRLASVSPNLATSYLCGMALRNAVLAGSPDTVAKLRNAASQRNAGLHRPRFIAAQVTSRVLRKLGWGRLLNLTPTN